VEKQFATAINCIDGRVQEPVIKYIKVTHKVDFIDMVTEPGVNKVLSDNVDKSVIASIKRKVELSILRNLSRTILVAGHYDCKANPAGEEEQKRQIADAVVLIKKWSLPVEFIGGIWINENFQAEPVNEHLRVGPMSTA